jgi:hypothetical protein
MVRAKCERTFMIWYTHTSEIICTCSKLKHHVQHQKSQKTTDLHRQRWSINLANLTSLAPNQSHWSARKLVSWRHLGGVRM